MICDVPDPEASVDNKPMPEQRSEPRSSWWARPSPWLWGVGLLLLLAIAATQLPRISSAVFAPKPQPSPVTRATTARLAGPAYTQAMVANRNFVGADLRGARLAHLDLRGKDFERADAAGAVFSGSLLNGTDFAHADLRGADLRDTCLRGSILTGASLAGADFTGADVTGATVSPLATAQAIGWTPISDSTACADS
jgi:hypothetical protein